MLPSGFFQTGEKRAEKTKKQKEKKRKKEKKKKGKKNEKGKRNKKARSGAGISKGGPWAPACSSIFEDPGETCDGLSALWAL
jgi:hypothetical protein